MIDLDNQVVVLCVDSQGMRMVMVLERKENFHTQPWIEEELGEALVPVWASYHDPGILRTRNPLENNYYLLARQSKVGQAISETHTFRSSFVAFLFPPSTGHASSFCTIAEIPLSLLRIGRR